MLGRAALMSVCAIAATLLAVPPAANAWGVQGHNTTGTIADLRLSASAREDVDRLLAGEPNPTLGGVANWADEVRKNDPELGKISAPWHYVNIGENGCVYEPAVNGNDGQNVIEALRKQTAILGNKTRSDADRNQALKFVVHFVGDIHQPLHAGVRPRPRRQRIQGPIRRPQHQSALGVGQPPARHPARERCRRTTAPARPPRTQLACAATGLRPVRWAQESCHLVETPGFYPASSTIGDDYTRQFLPIAESQLRLAGERLGQLLNAVLTTPPTH